jgi:hypothetical protein
MSATKPVPDKIAEGYDTAKDGPKQANMTRRLNATGETLA